MPMTQTLRDDIDTLSGDPLSDREWALLRQCLRCLIQGKRIVAQPGRKVKRIEPGYDPLNESTAISAILHAAKIQDISVVAAARSLVILTETPFTPDVAA